VDLQLLVLRRFRECFEEFLECLNIAVPVFLLFENISDGIHCAEVPRHYFERLLVRSPRAVEVFTRAERYFPEQAMCIGEPFRLLLDLD